MSKSGKTPLAYNKASLCDRRIDWEKYKPTLWELFLADYWYNGFLLLFRRGTWVRLLQRLTRGWDDSDTWSLDVSVAKFLLPRLKRYRELRQGVPADLYRVCCMKYTHKRIKSGQKYEGEECYEYIKIKNDWELTEKQSRDVHNKAEKMWDTEIREMIDWLQDIVDENSDEFFSPKFQRISHEERGKLRERGKKLYCERFEDLWW